MSVLEMTAEIVAAYLEKNAVVAADLPTLIKTVHGTLANIDAPAAEEAPAIAKATAAQIRKSITPDALISFEDGKPYKMLKRHLRTQGMTIPEYRAKWGLPNDYPVAAPSYSAKRSEMARALGLGRKAGETKAEATAPKPVKRGVKKAAAV